MSGVVDYALVTSGTAIRPMAVSSVASSGVCVRGPVLEINLLSAPTGAVALSPKITFTRASTGTYVGSTGVINTAAVDVPRFDYDPITLALKGLLIEKASTNLVLFSDQINNVTWVKAGGTVTTDATTAPDGTVSAELLVEDTSTGGHSVTQSIVGLPDSTVYTVSAYVKPNSRNWIAVSFADKANVNNRVWYNITTGTQGTTNGTVTAFSAVAAGNGWYRISVSASTGTGVSVPALRFSLGSADNTASYTGNGTSGAFIWGTQVELGAFSTSYIPTTATSVARSTDLPVINGTNFSSWFNATAGTMVVEGLTPAGLATSPVTGGAFSNGSLTNNNVMTMYATASTFAATIKVGGVAAGTDPTVSVTAATGSLYKHALAYTATSAVVAANGKIGTAQAMSSLPTVSEFRVGTDGAGTGQTTAWVRRITYFPYLMSNASVAAMTT